jgi:hypothetical protein
MYYSAGAVGGGHFWNTNGSQIMSLSSTATLSPNGGFQCRQGINGATGNVFNTYWTGSALQCWIDTANIGNFSICDYRIKENIQPPTNVLERLCKVNMFSYELKEINIFKKNGCHLGFFAHELKEAFPELNNLVSGEKDELTKDGHIQPQTITTEFTHLLMKAIQEQNTLIQSLQESVKSLQERLTMLENK